MVAKINITPPLSYLYSLKRRRRGSTPNSCPLRASPKQFIRRTMDRPLVTHKTLTNISRKGRLVLKVKVASVLLTNRELALFTNIPVGRKPYSRKLVRLLVKVIVTKSRENSLVMLSISSRYSVVIKLARLYRLLILLARPAVPATVITINT